MAEEKYRKNNIETKKSGNTTTVTINGRKIATVSARDLKAGVTTDYNYLPVSNPIELARQVIDEQSSLANPTLKDFVTDG